MSKENRVTRFKKVFCNTLKADKNGNYVRIPIVDYQELSFFRSNIVDAIEMIADLQISEENNDISKLGFTIKSLILILKSTSMIEESQGIKEFFE